MSDDHQISIRLTRDHVLKLARVKERWSLGSQSDVMTRASILCDRMISIFEDGDRVVLRDDRKKMQFGLVLPRGFSEAKDSETTDPTKFTLDEQTLARLARLQNFVGATSLSTAARIGIEIAATVSASQSEGFNLLRQTDSGVTLMAVEPIDIETEPTPVLVAFSEEERAAIELATTAISDQEDWLGDGGERKGEPVPLEAKSADEEGKTVSIVCYRPMDFENGKLFMKLKHCSRNRSQVSFLTNDESFGGYGIWFKFGKIPRGLGFVSLKLVFGHYQASTEILARFEDLQREFPNVDIRKITAIE